MEVEPLGPFGFHRGGKRPSSASPESSPRQKKRQFQLGAVEAPPLQRVPSGQERADWVARTRQLHLATPTPPASVASSAHEDDTSMDIQEELPAYAGPSNIDNPRSPHSPPDLASNLAGSPQHTTPAPSEIAEDEDQSMQISSQDTVTAQSTTRRPKQQPGTATGYRITMGFRSDCEKCRLRTPGHYSHIEMLGGDGRDAEGRHVIAY